MTFQFCEFSFFLGELEIINIFFISFLSYQSRFDAPIILSPYISFNNIKPGDRKKAILPVPLVLFYKSGMLFIQLPSGRRLSYVKPRIGTNQFGGESVTY